ncbi:MAG: energy transducer TonB [Terriglobia bacterium]
MTLRGFYQERKLKYNELGAPVQTYTPGPWTLFGKLYVKKLQLKKDKAVIQAERLFVLYDDAKKEQIVRTGKNVRIEVAFSTRPTDPSLPSLLGALTRVFLTSQEQLSDFVPDLWKQFVVQQESPTSPPASTEDESSQLPLPPGVHRIGHDGVSPPECIACPDPMYEPIAHKRGIEGVVSFWTTVAEDGTIRNLKLNKPLGAGLDERAAYAIRGWRFKPAQRDGKPVAVHLIVEIKFRLTH